MKVILGLEPKLGILILWSEANTVGIRSAWTQISHTEWTKIPSLVPRAKAYPSLRYISLLWKTLIHPAYREQSLSSAIAQSVPARALHKRATTRCGTVLTLKWSCWLQHSAQPCYFISIASNSRYAIKNGTRLPSEAHPVAHTSYQVELCILPSRKEWVASHNPLLNTKDVPVRKRNITAGTWPGIVALVWTGTCFGLHKMNIWVH